MFRKTLTISIVALALVLLGNPAVAQTTGQITGLVQDDKGETLPGATVVATSPAMQGERAVTTAGNGKFNLAVLPTGVYTLKVSMVGHQTVILDGIDVRLGQSTPVSIALPVGELTEAVTVTADAPLIETRTATTTTNLSAKVLDTLPTSTRTFRDLTKYVPSITSVEVNTSTGQGVGFPSIRGEGQYGDNYLIDGLTVRDPAVKTTATPLPYDAIEEVQIITDGFEPEYGQALGGSVNVITKTGSNTFGGEVAYLYSGDNLSAEYEPTFLATPTDFSSQTPYGNVGGAILKDHLWYFLSYNHDEVDDTYAPVEIEGFGTLEEGNIVNDSDTYFGKLSYSFNPNHNLSANYTLQDVAIEGLGAEAATPVARQTQEQENTRLRVNYQGIFSANSVLELKYGTMDRTIDTLPVGTIDAAQYEYVSYGIVDNNAWRLSADERTRDDYAAIYSHFLNTSNWGSHELKAGYEYHEPQQLSGDQFTGVADDVFDEDINPESPTFGGPDTFNLGTKFQFVNQVVGTSSVAIPDVLNEYRSGDMLGNRSEEWGFFLQDRWEIGRFNILAGFRADKQKGYNDSEKIFAEFDYNDSFSPRLAVTWDFTGDGKNVLKSGWGRFYDVNGTRFGEFANERESYSFRSYGWAGAAADTWDGIDFSDHIGSGDEYDIENPANWEFVLEQSNTGAGITYEGVTGPPEVERFLVEYNRQVGNSYAFKTRYVTSKARALIDDVNTLQLGGASPLHFVVVNTDLKKRDYESIEFEFNGAPTPNFSFTTSYVHSASKGTNPGQFEAAGFLGDSGSGNDIGVYLDRPPSDPQFWCDFYGPACVPASWASSATPWRRDYNNDDVVNQFDRDLERQTVFAGLGALDDDDDWYGYLPYSIDDLVKVSGRFNLPKLGNTYVTLFGQWASGYHTQRRGFQGAYGDFLTFSENGHFVFQNSVDPALPCTGFADCEAVLVTTPVDGQNFSEESGTPRGSANNSSFWSIDMNVGKVFTFAKNYDLELRLELVNLFNEQIPLTVQDRAVSNYGEPLTRQVPRSARIFARFAF